MNSLFDFKADVGNYLTLTAISNIIDSTIFSQEVGVCVPPPEGSEHQKTPEMSKLEADKYVVTEHITLKNKKGRARRSRKGQNFLFYWLKILMFLGT